MENKKRVRIGVIGCGRFGRKRIEAVIRSGNGTLAAVADLDPKNLEAVGQLTEAYVTTDGSRILEDPSIDAVIVSTSHDSLFAAAHYAVRNGKHVLVEKPGAVLSSDLYELQRATGQMELVVRVGYTLRFHPAIQKAFQILRDDPSLGAPLFLRAHYGHGGREGYENEWRMADPGPGSGELMDQGVHLLDLARLFLGDVGILASSIRNLYWRSKGDDNAFVMLGTDKGTVAVLHASCTEWKNSFRLELMLRNGKLQIDGLGGSYGPETLQIFLNQGLGVPPKQEVVPLYLPSPHRNPILEETWSFINACQDGERDVQLEGPIQVLRLVEHAREFAM